MSELSIWGIILAAGQSRRLGQNKLLLSHEGESLLAHTIKKTQLALEHLVVVVSEPETRRLCEQLEVSYVYNQQPETGQSHSIFLAVEKTPPHVALMFIAADQPFMSVEEILLLKTAYFEHQKITYPVWGSRSGNPVIFPPRYRRELLELQGDQGGRLVRINHPEACLPVPISDEQWLWDVDTPEDLEQIRKWGEWQ